MSIHDWWAAGTMVPLRLSDTERSIFVRSTGSGPTVTLLHGYPSCSHDWSAVADQLAGDHTLLMPDLLGFGASDKPSPHAYSIHEQADLVEALWAHHATTSTVLVAHDYSATVAQELLARHAEERLSVRLTAVLLLNGGIYPDLHRPEPVQTALLDPVQGPLVSAAMTREAMTQALRPTFAADFDFQDAADDIWAANTRGHVNIHDTISYITDRRTHADRWVSALEGTGIPLSFVWGLLDPISGAHMIERVHTNIPTAVVNELGHVGHWPLIEAPEAVADAVRGLT
ncbi:alpha/beta fold hydrolase [Nocardioides jiangxiensis]|uniref:Alpha/beta hydrolase n=1 Tax=Nocardioides jiangxiensis TaxID=3064524 RepID=A0ABT9B407_9ACTN|nr:alpha/beta hydrolase [Nocardioides sp. WY-20]MDO7869452.1 alpha/beta hydrolase [Nocardioides sp. WY-20]